MGDGPKPGPSIEPSAKASILDRVLSTRVGDGGSPDNGSDVCTAARTLTVRGDTVRLALGDTVRIGAASPPQVFGPHGFIGEVAGREAARIEDCIRARFRFSGSVVEVAHDRVRVIVEGARV